MCASTFRAFFRCIRMLLRLTTLIAVISRDSVSPPDLTGNTPVTDVLKPVQVSLVKTLRNKLKLAVLDSCQSLVLPSHPSLRTTVALIIGSTVV